MIADQLCPRIYGAGNGDRVWRLPLDRGDTVAHVPVGARGRRRPSRSVESDEPSAGRRVEYEAITTYSRGAGLDHALYGAGGHSRVHRVAARLQHVYRGER